MRPPFLTIGLVLSFSSLIAEEPRLWTQQKTGAQLKGVIIDRKRDKSAIQIQKQEGTKHWIQSETLSPADQKFIQLWVPPEEIITARVEASGKGWKRIHVIAQAGPEKLRVVAHRVQGKREPITRNMKVGETLEFTYTAEPEYVIKAWRGKKVVDQESDGKKTGL